jgi:4-amino-4-deoxy-L-arabinose transferase-like glycosyltransferase
MHEYRGRTGVLAVPASLAVLKILIHLPVLHRYGYHNDELYFIACGNHLSFGYVDHAPLVPWIARLATTLFGESLTGLRIFATLAGAGAILLTGLLVHRLGGGRFAQLLACTALLVAPVSMRTGNMLCIPAFEPLFWLGCALVLVRMIQDDNPRLWCWLGLLVGLGLMNKHSMLFFAFGLGVATLATPLRRHLRTPWPWIGAVIALTVFSPNVVWQMLHGWPTAQFLRNLNENVMAGISKVQFVAGQFMYLNPFAAFVWIWGLVYLFSKQGRAFRALGWIWVSIFFLLLATDSKIYYFAPAFPAVIAVGGLAIERFIAARDRAWLKPAFIALLLIGGIAMAPAALPYLSIDATDRYMETVTLGAFGNIYELTGDLHAMFGWPERVEVVSEVYESLPPAERERTMLFAAGYGNAGAIDHLGSAAGLPPAVSFAQTYWMWGYPEGPIDTVIGVNYDVDFLTQIWEEVEVVKSVDLANVNPWQTPFEVTICRKPKIAMEVVWPQVRPW